MGLMHSSTRAVSVRVYVAEAELIEFPRFRVGTVVASDRLVVQDVHRSTHGRYRVRCRGNDASTILLSSTKIRRKP